MKKAQTLLEGVDLSQVSAIEIGALDKPVVPRDSPRIFYVDYTDTETLRRNYRADPMVDTEKIVDVSGIWGEQTLAQAASSVAPVDLIIASHVIEHVPDLVTWLKELESVLKPHGEVRLVVPDRRYCFDMRRSETEAADVLAAYLVKARIPQPQQVLDFTLNAVTVDCVKAWNGQLQEEDLVRMFSDEGALHLANDVLQNANYHDVHCWVFNPLSFARLMRDLSRIGVLNFGCSKFIDTEKNTLDFFYFLKKMESKEAIVQSWKSVIEEIEDVQAGKVTQERELHERAALENESLKKRIAQLIEESRSLQAEVVAMRSTVSWRITKPIRFVRSAMRSF